MNVERSLSRHTTLRLMGLGAASAVIPAVVNGCSTRVAQGQATSPVQNQASDVLMKEIPRTNEKIPAVGMGTFLTFDVLENQPRDAIQQVMRRFWANGGRMVGVSPLYGMSEVNVGEFAEALGLTSELYYCQ